MTWAPHHLSLMAMQRKRQFYCEVCFTPFQNVSPNALYCSSKCRNEALKQRQEKRNEKRREQRRLMR